MSEIPSMWRTELLHPLSVHFPVAILITSAVCGLVYLAIRRSNTAPYLRFTLSLTLWTGVVLFWIAFYTGQLAYSIEVRQICDPTVLKSHLRWAYVTGIIFSLGLVVDMLQRFWLHSQSRVLTIALVFLLTIGAGSMGYLGHLGARLVYQQAAGVYQPSEDCSEFE